MGLIGVWLNEYVGKLLEDWMVFEFEVMDIE